ncbi:hypothetical protein [Ideonella livida]|uniref:Protein kinase domain-containing protein n=1 Tax=Ideonella livida TaxID=2707176 RepID=A0A7C9TM88_9BURK|nr:hypothetical protein [Ideonella livida]NDY93881.1 hypothetical protein [Ideonella livida]
MTVTDRPSPPSTFPADRYQRLAPLGRDGTGGVVAAWDVALARPVALKTLPPAPDTAGPGAMAAVPPPPHPAFVAVHEVWSAPRDRQLVMERVFGLSLARALQDGPLPHPAACAWIGQLAQALGAAHAAGQAHGHLRLSQLMLTPPQPTPVQDEDHCARLLRQTPPGELSHWRLRVLGLGLPRPAPAGLADMQDPATRDAQALVPLLRQCLLPPSRATVPPATPVPPDWPAALRQLLDPRWPGLRPLQPADLGPLAERLRQLAHTPDASTVAAAPPGLPGPAPVWAGACAPPPRPGRMSPRWPWAVAVALLSTLVAGATALWMQSRPRSDAGRDATLRLPVNWLPPAPELQLILRQVDLWLAARDDHTAPLRALSTLQPLTQAPAPPHAGLAAARSLAHALQHAQNPGQPAAREQARYWAALALALDGRLARAHLAQAHALWLQQDADGARAACLRARQLDPHDPLALALHADLLAAALEPAPPAAPPQPVDPLDQTQEVLAQALQRLPPTALWHSAHGTVLGLQGRWGLAAQAQQQALDRVDTSAGRTAVARPQARLAGALAHLPGQATASRTALAAAMGQASDDPEVQYQAAVVAALLGEPALVRRRLQRALAGGYPLTLAQREPALRRWMPQPAGTP